MSGAMAGPNRRTDRAITDEAPFAPKPRFANAGASQPKKSKTGQRGATDPVASTSRGAVAAAVPPGGGGGR